MRNIELAYLFVAASMIWVMVRSTKGKKFPTFSHISTGAKVARTAFFWGLFIAAILFALLMYTWFIPHFSLGNSFLVLTFLLTISQMLTGLFPTDAKYLGKLHTLFGSILALSMFTLLAAFAWTVMVPVSARIVCGIAAACMVTAFISTPWTLKNSKHILLHEGVFFGIWHAAILLTAYIA